MQARAVVALPKLLKLGRGDGGYINEWAIVLYYWANDNDSMKSAKYHIFTVTGFKSILLALVYMLPGFPYEGTHYILRQRHRTAYTFTEIGSQMA